MYWSLYYSLSNVWDSNLFYFSSSSQFCPCNVLVNARISDKLQTPKHIVSYKHDLQSSCSSDFWLQLPDSQHTNKTINTDSGQQVRYYAQCILAWLTKSYSLCLVFWFLVTLCCLLISWFSAWFWLLTCLAFLDCLPAFNKSLPETAAWQLTLPAT